MGKPKRKKKIPFDQDENTVPTNSRSEPQDLIITFLVKPSARTDRLYFEGDRAFLDIGAPPVKGKANRAIIQFLNRELSIPKANIVLKRGHTSHEKTFQFIAANITLEILKEKYRI